MDQSIASSDRFDQHLESLGAATAEIDTPTRPTIESRIDTLLRSMPTVSTDIWRGSLVTQPKPNTEDL